MQSSTQLLPESGVVTGVGLNQNCLASLKRQLKGNVTCESLPSEHRLHDQVEQGILRADAILLGTGIKQPINVAQKVHSFDKTIPVLILSDAEKCDELRRSIMFAPLLGNVVTPWSIDDLDRVGTELATSVERHRQRRFYLDSIDSVQPVIGNLSLSQPELGHYLGRVLEQAPVGVVSLDADGEILSTNNRASKILGVKDREVHGRLLSEFISDQDRDRFENLLKRSAVGQQFGMKPEVIQSIPIGLRARFLEATASTIVYRATRRGYMVILQDVTTREIAETQRKKAEDHMRNLSTALEQAAESVMISNSDRVIEYVNPAFVVLTGYSRQQAMGRKTSFLRSDANNPEIYEKIRQTIDAGQVYRGVLVNNRKDGSVYYEEKTITPIKDNEGKITNYISTGHDITEKIRNEEAARVRQEESAHAARLSTLGEMVSGIAHELNQPLCAIKTYAQICKRVLASKEQNRPKMEYGLDQVVKQAELAAGIFERLLNFSRKGGEPKSRVDLFEIAAETTSLISAEMKQNSTKLTVIGEIEQAWITADRIQIEQVLINLIRNGIEAMSDCAPESKQLLLRISSRGGKIKATLFDKGKGCSKDVVERLFEPFFSTKKKGLGIGLGISQSIIEDHGGKLFLEKNEPTGAAFSFELPELKPH